MTASQEKVSGYLNEFVNNAVGSLFVGGAPGVWLAVDLKGRMVVPNGYMLSFHEGGNYGGHNAPRSWNFEGSNDGATWTLLKAHVNDQTFNGTIWTAYWPVPATNYNKGYSHFRVVLTSKNSGDRDALLTSCIELYGELLDP